MKVYKNKDGLLNIYSDESIVPKGFTETKLGVDEYYKQLNAMKKGAETQSEKETDQKEAQEVLVGKRFLVNITTEGDKKVATIHDSQTTATSIELDEERGDKFFDTIEEAKKYAESFA